MKKSTKGRKKKKKNKGGAEGGGTRGQRCKRRDRSRKIGAKHTHINTQFLDVLKREKRIKSDDGGRANQPP